MPDDPVTLARLSEQHAHARANALALVDADRRWTWASFHDAVLRTVAVLRALGLGAGDRLAFLGYNRDLYIVLLQACYRAGIVLAPLNWRLACSELDYILRHARIGTIVVDPEFAALGHQAASAAGVAVVPLSATSDSLAARIECALPDPEAAPVMPDSVALLLYSSGTTGFPKGVLITHDNLLTGLRDVRATGQAWGAWLPEETVLLATPIFHIGGTGWVTQALAAGSATVAIPRPEVTAMVRAITTEKVTKFFAVPAILSMMMKDGQASRANFASVRYILYGASPISLAVLKEAMATFVNAEFVQVYGATETTGAITYLSPEEHRHSDEALLESCGKPFPGGAARIVDADGKVLAAGEIGEIEIRSSAVTPGYLDDAEATRAAFHHGWYRTGDAGYRDAEGYLYIRDRIKDMIVSGGENIYPAEVEAVLNTHPAVDECAIIGVPDARWGETAKAVVVLRAGAEASGEQLRDFLRGRVAGYKIPKSIDFTGSLPRNPSGKILKRTLREPYWRDEGRRIA